MNRDEIINRHKRRWHEGDSEGSVSLNESIEDFENIINNRENPTVHKVEYTQPFEIDMNNKLTTNIIVSDVTRNDGDAQDSKLIHTSLKSQLNSGSYVWWSNEVWLVANEEKNSVEAYRTYIMKRCSNKINIKLKGIVYTYPIVIDNLTLYGDGIAEGVNITTQDGKRSVMIINNAITSNLDIMSRIMIGKKTIFKVSMIDDFTNEGTYSMTLVQIQFNSKDDRENIIAYNEFSEVKPIDIVGNDYIYLGSTNIYTCNNSGNWNCNIGDLKILEDGSCELKCPTDANYIGKVITLSIGEVSKNIKIRGLI